MVHGSYDDSPGCLSRNWGLENKACFNQVDTDLQIYWTYVG